MDNYYSYGIHIRPGYKSTYLKVHQSLFQTLCIQLVSPPPVFKRCPPSITTFSIKFMAWGNKRCKHDFLGCIYTAKICHPQSVVSQLRRFLKSVWNWFENISLLRIKKWSKISYLVTPKNLCFNGENLLCLNVALVLFANDWVKI